MESNELNKLVNKTETEAWIVAQTDSSQRESETGGWMKEGEGIKQNTHTPYNMHGHRQQWVDSKGEMGTGLGRGGQRG